MGEKIKRMQFFMQHYRYYINIYGKQLNYSSTVKVVTNNSSVQLPDSMKNKNKHKLVLNLLEEWEWEGRSRIFK